MTTTNDHNVSEFRREIAERTRPYVERLSAFRNQQPRKVHHFVTVAMEHLIDLIGYASDSTIDEYQNEIDPAIDGIDVIEEYASCGYNTELFSDPTSAEYRSYATEVAEWVAIHENLNEWEIAFLRAQSDMWGLLENLDDRPFEEKLVELFDAQMTILENL